MEPSYVCVLSRSRLQRQCFVLITFAPCCSQNICPLQLESPQCLIVRLCSEYVPLAVQVSSDDFLRIPALTDKFTLRLKTDVERAKWAYSFIAALIRVSGDAEGATCIGDVNANHSAVFPDLLTIGCKSSTACALVRSGNRVTSSTCLSAPASRTTSCVHGALQAPCVLSRLFASNTIYLQ